MDSDGEPLPSQDEIKNIINSIPSYRFEEASNDGYESSAMSQKKSTKGGGGAAAASQHQNSTQDSFTERKRKEIKRQETEVSCSICISVLRTGE